MKKKIPWVTPAERKRMEILYRDTEHRLTRVDSPELREELETHLRTIRRELEFDRT